MQNTNAFNDDFEPEDDFTPEKEKVGKTKSALYGIAEGILGIPALVQYGVNEWSKALEQAFGQEDSNLSFEKENPILNLISQFPESEDQASRRIRTGVSGATIGALGGIPGIIAGVVGSQAGQTVREIFGKEGKFENFGWGEGAAIGSDLLAGGIAGIGASLARSSTRAGAGAGASQVPSIFQQGRGILANAQIKNVIQGEKNALTNIIDNFGNAQLQGFEREAASISPNRYSELRAANVSGLQRQADQMFRTNNLSIISPLHVTPEQGGELFRKHLMRFSRIRLLMLNGLRIVPQEKRQLI